jgi:phosphatidylserine decarboxylase
MGLTRYGLDTAIPILIAAAVVIAVGLFVSQPAWKAVLIVVGAAVFLFTAWFFRDPERRTPGDADAVISPADGRIVIIKETAEPNFLGDSAVQISIFMSPLNVHVNRFPFNGTVAFHRYIPGKFLVAWEEKASEANERALIGIERGSTRILFTQIAGVVARRIVCPVRVGDSAVAGRRFGMIKFGSRVDVFVPRSARVLVRLNQNVTAGETILARVAEGE